MKSNYQSRLIVIALFLGVMLVKSTAINYTIAFTGSGISATIDSVIVQNLTKGTSVKVPAGTSLNLTDATSVEDVNADNEFISIYPNPATEKATVSFYAKQNGDALLKVIGLSGQTVITTIQNLQEGKNSFQLSLPQGIYLVQVKGNNIYYTAKVVSQSDLINSPELIYSQVQKLEPVRQKSEGSTVIMAYSPGDQLIYKGFSGNNKTLVADVPIQSKTTNFEFVECKDGGGRYYTITKIGTQVWMAENLAYLPVAASDPTVGLEDEANWTTKTTPYYYVYDLANYGVLYNWYAALAAIPAGWHLPTDAEWTTLSTYLGGESVAGGKMKSTTGWKNNTEASNSSCFCALPGGYRDFDGNFYRSSIAANWWTSTEYNSGQAWMREIFYMDKFTAKYYINKHGGLSVRCIRDN